MSTFRKQTDIANPYANLTKTAFSAIRLHPPPVCVCPKSAGAQGNGSLFHCHTVNVLYPLTETYENGVSGNPPPCTPGFAIVQNLLTHLDNGKTSVAQKASSGIVQYCRLRESWLVQKWTIPAYLQNLRQAKNYEKLRDFTNRGKVIRMRRSDT